MVIFIMENKSDSIQYKSTNTTIGFKGYKNKIEESQFSLFIESLFFSYIIISHEKEQQELGSWVRERKNNMKL